MHSPNHVRRISLALLASCFALLALTPPSQADELPVGGPWSFSLGAYDILEDYSSVEAGVAYSFVPFRLWGLDIRPTVGVSATGNEAVWAYGGFRYDLPWRTERFFASIVLSASLYDDGDGKDLGGPLEFRSSLDLSWVLRGGSRVGFSFYHLSNAGIYDPNPGQESLVLFWSPP